MHPGLIGGIVGGIIGLAGGVLGTYFSIHHAKGPKERVFMIKSSLIFWISALLFITLLLTLSSPYKWLLWLPYGIVLPLSIRFMNSRLCQIQQEEADERAGSAPTID